MKCFVASRYHKPPACGPRHIQEILALINNHKRDVCGSNGRNKKPTCQRTFQLFITNNLG